MPVRSSWLAFAAVAIGSFLGPFSGSIVIVGMPAMAHDFAIDIQSIKWVVIVYLSLATMLLPLAGLLGRRFGATRLFVGGFALFGLGAILAALAPLQLGLAWLLLARLLQSIGAALLFGVSLALVTRTVAPDRRSMAFGIIGSVVSVALIIGQPLGIVLCDVLDWRWVFWVQVPVALAGLLASIILLPRDAETSAPPLALRSFAAWVVLITAATFLGEAYSKGLMLGLLPVTWLVFIAALLAFIWLERIGSTMFDYTLLQHPAFWRGTVAAVLVNFAMYSLIMLLPFYLDDFLQLPTAMKSLLFALSPMTTVFAGPFAGLLADRHGFRTIILSGLAFLTLAYILMFWGTSASSLWLLSAGLLLMGLGGGIFSGPNYSAMMGTVSHAGRSMASSFCSLTRNIGFLLGASVGSILFGLLLAGIGGRELMIAARTSEISTALTTMQFSHAFAWVLMISAVLTAVALAFSWRIPNRVAPPLE